MRRRIDKDNDALLLRLNETASVESEGVQPGVIRALDNNGSVVGVEIPALSTRADPDRRRIMLLETT